MSHKILKMASSQKEWHHSDTGHATLTPGASLDTWREASGLDFDLYQKPVVYHNTLTNEYQSLDNRVHLYRSDNGEPVSIMSPRYRVHQPGEILKFFGTVAKEGGWQLESAGVLEGSTCYWGLARLADSDGGSFSVQGDAFGGYVLLVTSCDGSLATQGMLTTVRVVCSNTLRAALSRDKAGKVSQSHRGEFDAYAMASRLGMIDSRATIEQMQQDLAKLQEIPVNPLEAVRMFAQLIRRDANCFADLLESPQGGRPDEQRTREECLAIRGVKGMVRSYLEAPGACQGTAYGVLQGVTHYVDHAKQGKSAARSAMTGNGAELKDRTFQELLTLGEAA